MRAKLIAGNWKMNGTRDQAIKLIEAIADGLVSEQSEDQNREVLICPPAVYLETALDAIGQAPIALGAQNLSAESSGAYTGEVSGAMLTDVKCQYVLVGHSERRSLYGETNALVARKFVAAQDAGLTPILCIGETLEQRENDETVEIVQEQVKAVIDVCGISALNNSVIAYEPVWAIGTGVTASPEQAQEVHQQLRAFVAAFDAAVADGLRIVYGGSMNADNAATLLAQTDIDGGLIGGASLQADAFLTICRAAG